MGLRLGAEAALGNGSLDVIVVEAYLDALPAERRAVLQHLREVIRAAAAEATEAIAYEMPAFRSNGRFLVSYAAYRRHFSLFPASPSVKAHLGEEIRPFLAGAGTLRFTAVRPLPDELVTRIVQLRLEEVASGHR